MFTNKNYIIREVMISSDYKLKKVLFRRKTSLEIISILLQLIPTGYVTTYKALAKVLNTNPRYVGYLVKENKNPIIIPCHRVIKSDGSLGGYTLNRRSLPEFKERLLRVEGVEVVNGRVPKNYIIDDIDSLIKNL
jgi:methylated-DNA-[protein]-cysteine S-methyltransferase